MCYKIFDAWYKLWEAVEEMSDFMHIGMSSNMPEGKARPKEI